MIKKNICKCKCIYKKIGDVILVLPDQLICIPHRVGRGSDADIHPLYLLELPNETYIFTEMSFD